MWTDDDVLTPRTARWWRRLKTVDLEVALKLTLLTTSLTLALGMAFYIVQSVLAAIRTVLGWVGY